ncbi:hypothetical protein BDY21DRAFT_161102 [Lineolata rhizophorae]|uniref:BHLH domain-containing protein n=1 Tax=Lineolata rhizophorae TaxID=578093 RepID=A0A6A6P8J0_9PEZI|nr:hypothetical protein BDY21DRAFT_161102 [Lineolata rhizophorae]
MSSYQLRTVDPLLTTGAQVPPPPSPSMSTRLVTSAAISPLTPAITDSFFNEAARASSQSDFDSEGEDNPEFEPEPGDVDVQQQDEQQQQFASKGKERQEPTSSSPRKDDVDKPPPPKRKRGRPPLPKPEPGSNIIPGSRRLPHNQVERKYREGLNAQLERLRHAVPTLPQGENVAQKPSKAMVLAAAIEYIHGLENERDTLLDEVEQLRNMLSGGGRPMQPSGWAGRGFAGRGYGSRGYGWRRGT